jgi:hypothetical protein
MSFSFSYLVLHHILIFRLTSYASLSSFHVFLFSSRALKSRPKNIPTQRQMRFLHCYIYTPTFTTHLLITSSACAGR